MNRLKRLSLEIFGIAALAGSAFLAAQSQATGPATSLVQDATRDLSLDLQKPLVYALSTSSDSGACPIHMHALQKGGGSLLNARDGHPVEFGQRIHLVLGNTAGSARIVAIEVSVYGTSGKNRAVPTLTGLDPHWDARKTFNLPVNMGENEEASTNLLLRGFTSVQAIILESVTYADGSVWSASLSRSCRIAPDPFMLVSVR